MRYRNRQSGFILLVTVVIIAAITSIILAYSRSVQLFGSNIEQIKSDVEIANAMQSSLDYIAEYLNKTENIPGETEFIVNFNGYECNISVQCENGKININKLVNNSDQYNTAYTNLLRRLIDYYNLSADDIELGYDIIPAIVDAIDTNNDVATLDISGRNIKGAENKYYKDHDMAEIPDKKLTNIEDLSFVKSCPTEKLYLKPNVYYRPFIDCLTTANIDKININCAPAEIIASLADNLSLEDAVLLDVHKKAQGYGTLEDFFQAAEIYSETTELESVLEIDSQNKIYSIVVKAGNEYKTRKLKALAQKDDNDRYNVKKLYSN